jgi:hypothetical protein
MPKPEGKSPSYKRKIAQDEKCSKTKGEVYFALNEREVYSNRVLMSLINGKEPIPLPG